MLFFQNTPYIVEVLDDLTCIDIDNGSSIFKNFKIILIEQNINFSFKEKFLRKIFFFLLYSLTYKQKEFNKRQTTEVKKLKDILSKIDKQNRKLSQDLDKQVKLDEKEKNASSVSKMFGKADEIEVIEDSKINENDESGESNDSKTESKSDSKGIEDINTENSEPKGTF